MSLRCFLVEHWAWRDRLNELAWISSIRFQSRHQAAQHLKVVNEVHVQCTCVRAYKPYIRIEWSSCRQQEVIISSSLSLSLSVCVCVCVCNACIGVPVCVCECHINVCVCVCLSMCVCVCVLRVCVCVCVCGTMQWGCLSSCIIGLYSCLWKMRRADRGHDFSCSLSVSATLKNLYSRKEKLAENNLLWFVFNCIIKCFN